jgi:hypothetical protein
MPKYVVETYLPSRNGPGLDVRERRAHLVAQNLTRAGKPTRFDGALDIPSDEMSFFIFDAPSATDAALAARQADLDPLRVVEAISSDGCWPQPRNPHKEKK